MCKLFLLTVAQETQDSTFLLSQSNDCLLCSNSAFRNFRVRTRADFHRFLRGKPCWQLDRKLLLAASRVLESLGRSDSRAAQDHLKQDPPSDPAHLSRKPARKVNQKDQLKAFLTEKYEKLQEYRKQNPNVSSEDIRQYVAKNRAAGREKIEKFLTPDQLAKWDAEVSKAKDFLSRRAASA